MTTYVIFRHGSNAANQPMTPRALVAVVEDASADAAVAACEVECYNNQHLEAKLASRLTAAEREELREWEREEVLWSEILQPEQVGCIVCGRHPSGPLTRREAENYYCGCRG